MQTLLDTEDALFRLHS